MSLQLAYEKQLLGRIITDKEQYYQNADLTTDEACRILKVSRVTLWSWRKKGILMPARIGNLLRYKTADIEAMTK